MDDVFPRRNLGLAEHWGRRVENRLDDVYDEIVVQQGSVSGLSRNTASTSGDLARRIQATAEAYASLPVPFSYNSTALNFSLSAAWTARGRVTIPVPQNASEVDIFALGRVSVADPSTTVSTTYFNWPFPLASVTSEYGMRTNPVTGAYRMHWGMDFSYGGINGTAIKATGDGTVRAKGYDSGRGNWIELSHPGPVTLRTRYFHMQAQSPLAIGASVTRGVTTLGVVGTTGNSTGPHLHWETEADGDTINPREFMSDYSESSSSIGPPPLWGRLSIAGSTSMEIFGAIIGGFQLVHGRTLPVTPGGVVVVENQLRSSKTHPADTGRSSSLTVLGAFRP